MADEEPEEHGGWPVDWPQGQMIAVYKEEHLCCRCIVQAICKVADAQSDEMLVVIRRCAAFIDNADAV